MKLPNVTCNLFVALVKQTENKTYAMVPYNIDVKGLMVILTNRCNEFPRNYRFSRLLPHVTRTYLPFPIHYT